MKARSFIPLLLGLCSLVAALGCSSGSEENGLATTYPTDLAITSPFATESAVEGLVRLPIRSQTSSEEVPLLPFDRKKEELDKRLVASDATGCGFVIRLFHSPRAVTCYGPPIDYLNHPDAPVGAAPPNPPVLPPGDVGIWAEYEAGTGEACISAKINSLMSETQAQVDMAVDLATAMLCIARLNGTDQPPDIGQSRDYTPELAGAGLPVTPTVARLTRGNDTADGHAQFRTELSAAGSPGGNAVGIDLHLRHIPLDGKNASYKGQLWYAIRGDFDPGLCNGAGIKMVALSILYSKSAEGLLTYRLQRAQYCDPATDPFDARNHLDPNKWEKNFHDITLNVDTSDGSGAYAFAWQAGSLDDNTRVFLAELSPGEAGTLGGCGYFGFGPRIGAENVGAIDRMICNWAGPGNDHTGLPFVQRQCVSRDAEKMLFISDPARLNIAYAPTNSCNSDSDTFTWGTDLYPPDRTGRLTNDLQPIADMWAALTAPGKPAEL